MGSESSLSCPITLNTALTPEQQALYQDEAVIRRILADCKTIAVVGLSTDTQRASYFTASYMQSFGYRIIPVNPKGQTILGEKCYPSLSAVPEKIDLVDIFRPAYDCPPIVEEAIAKGIGAIWFQLKIINLQAAERARKAGMKVVMDRCVKMEHGRYAGGLHEAGMNTEIITAKRATLHLPV
jgi:predicted CoA-binding protein